MSEPYYQDLHITLLHGDALEVLRSLPDESVNSCVTSPPYWGLRDYGTATWEGGVLGCEHKRVGNRDSRPRGGLEGGLATVNQAQEPQDRVICGRCGARRIDSQLGLEATPEAYVSALVDVFREIRRVLRKDGTLWLNLGDSYAAGKQGQDSFGDPSSGLNNGKADLGNKTGEKMPTVQRKPPPGLKPKDLVGIPWMVAFALRADGWYLRSDIIWSKPNPMPESVTDRPTKSHEYIFLLSKSERYWYDADAIKEPLAYAPHIPGNRAAFGEVRRNDFGTERMGEVWGTEDGRNKRSVWTVATHPYAGAHFATFPEDLIKPCILAGCPEGGVVLDPFVGSGTTAWVSKTLGRRCIGIDLNATYLDLAVERVRQQALPLFLE